MRNLNELNAIEPTHVGEILFDELSARKIRQNTFAVQTKILKSHINEIIKGKRGISAAHAVAFEEVLGISATYWLDFQSRYQINKIKNDKRDLHAHKIVS